MAGLSWAGSRAPTRDAAPGTRHLKHGRDHPAKAEPTMWRNMKEVAGRRPGNGTSLMAVALLAAVALLTTLACGQPSVPDATKAARDDASATTSTAQLQRAASKSASQAPDAALDANDPRMQEAVATWKIGALNRSQMLDASKDVDISLLADLSADDQVARDQLVHMPKEQLENAARWIVSRVQACLDMKREAPERLRKTFEARYNVSQRITTTVNRVFDSEVNARIPHVTDAQAQEYYDRHKHEYYQPFRFFMRHLFLTTYVTYEVKDGDTLESIAERVSGNKSKAGQIRWDVAQRPLRREPNKAFRPLVPGEQLLVPMDEQAAAKVKAKLEEILKQMSTGAKFEDLCRRNSQEARPGEVMGPLPSGTLPFLPEFLEMAKKTPVDGVSPIFRTAHGWQVIQIVKKQDATYLSFSQKRAQIVDAIQSDAREAAIAALIEKLYKSPRLKIDYGLIARQGDRLTSMSVVATVGGGHLYWKDAQAAWERFGKPREQERIVEAFKRVRELQMMLVVDLATDDLKNPNSPISKSVERARQLSEGQDWIAYKASTLARQGLTTQTIRQAYMAHRDSMFPALPKYAFLTMERRLTSEQRQPANYRDSINSLCFQMKNDLSTLRTANDFKAMALQVNAALKGQAPPPLASLAPIPRAAMPTPLQSAIDALKPGQWSPLIPLDNYRVASVLLLDKKVEGYRPFKEVFRQAAQVAFDEAYVRQEPLVTEQCLKEADFQMKP
jgi:parvulin-like peptidyl-prolyl isomerase